MPLTHVSYLSPRRGVMFTMLNGTEHIHCLATDDALVALGGTASSEAFDQNRARIERIAGDKFDRCELEGDRVIAIDSDSLGATAA
jgi:hypothetical protein